MPEKHENTVRHGGPGSSDQNADREPPPDMKAAQQAGKSTNPKTSQVSTGGGERDLRHSHDDAHRSSKTSHN